MTEKEFAEKIWEKSFSTIIVDYIRQPRNKKEVDTVIKIKLTCLTKMLRTMYRKYKQSIPTMLDMVNEFQALLYFGSLEFAKGKSEEELITVVDDFNIFDHSISKQYYNYLEKYIKGKLYDLYVMNKKELKLTAEEKENMTVEEIEKKEQEYKDKLSETLIGNFELDFDEFKKSNQKDTYYDLHIKHIKDYYSKENNQYRWLPEVLLWYWCNREDILTKSQLEFMDNLNRNLANEVYGRGNTKHFKDRIKTRILRKYEEYQKENGLIESKVA
ncbi:hypothetical protein CLNEO_13680 [Anaerotignum neopropionicum]|uniref:Uncharacterized protein n=1 Tax=Anaerotignum neopropionicum TaxID=36847 RepID=A0A136WFZ9_9FIRM|nr:hypothetical protein [Anaerotignum neopropionicum]KXL53397.1 hypothetical protein CLNEO_13680 [Anaerotignum neopropionicum]